ncbi:hypothetical protein [Actinopolymorpha alba]|uniref:hypothetical protein n=1 Tax=Actinopolymorpha alba TaxID=533267 RepID=UPI00036B5A6A|nr:hypothetical protein [Actinopolymorpha alba]
MGGVRRPLRPVAPVNHTIPAAQSELYNTLPAEAIGVDVERLITVTTMAEVEKRRAQLIDYIWKGHGLPAQQPHVVSGIDEPDLTELRRGRVDRLVVPLAYQVVSTSYLVWPSGEANGRFAIYHTSHGNPHAPPYGTAMLRATQALLDRGYAVVVVDMPFLGWNAQPIASPDDPSRLVWPQSHRIHEILAEYESPDFSALSIFLEPLAVIVNHLSTVAEPSVVAMVGLSGGAWATTVYALDPRITASFPVAGSWPFYLRTFPAHKPNHGDWEQRRDALPEFYALAGYLDLYVMGAAGIGRRQLQILNRFDPVCFQGVPHRSYAPVVEHQVALLGAGRWGLLDDATHDQHTVSPYAVSVLMWDLEES